MKRLFKNGFVVDVISCKIFKADVLIEDGIIKKVGDLQDEQADETIETGGKYICPGFIDGHIHIESSMMTPYEFTKSCISHGTSAVVADPHEIANVCGEKGIEYMYKASEGLPVTVYIMVPSCVPATGFDESYETLDAEKLERFFSLPRVKGLAEMMNYVGVIRDDENVLKKIELAKKYGKRIDGHAPLLSGDDLTKYINAGISSDHECSSAEEAKEKLAKGMWIMVRNGTAAKNLEGLLPLFDGPEADRCLICTDDKEPADMISDGHIDSIIRKAIKGGKDPVKCIKAATLNAAEYFNLGKTGAVAEGYKADILVLGNLEEVSVEAVYKDGEPVWNEKSGANFPKPFVDRKTEKCVRNSVHTKKVSPKDFYVKKESDKCRVIKVLPGSLLTEEVIAEMDFEKTNGIDTERDILKIAVIERHRKTGHIGIGYITGLGLKKGAVASTVSHDSHNIIVVGTNEKDMAAAVNEIRKTGGGNAVAVNGKIEKELVLEIAGLMSENDAAATGKACEEVRNYLHSLGVPENIAPLMNMAFVSLPVIPSLKLTTLGLADVNKFEIVPLFVTEK